MSMQHTCIIAEAGVNHNGSFALAKQLVDIAADCQCDYVKFQTFKSAEVISQFAEKAAYQKNTTGAQESQLEMVQKLELPFKDFVALRDYCAEKQIGFLSTAFDLESVDFLAALPLPLFKIPSGEITNLPYLRKVGALGRKLIMSTGMCLLEEVAAAIEILEQAGMLQEDITLLHCTTEYPAPLAAVNLRAMQTLRKAFPHVAGIGYSDHTRGITVPIAAVALGACLIEKHFTLDRTLEGPDHQASLEPDELKSMVAGIRETELVLGTGGKYPQNAELANRDIARKSIVASRDILRGEEFSADNITTKRPGTGISPMLWDQVIGTKADRDYGRDEAIAPARSTRKGGDKGDDTCGI